MPDDGKGMFWGVDNTLYILSYDYEKIGECYLKVQLKWRIKRKYILTNERLAKWAVVEGVGDDAAAGAAEIVGKELFQIHHGGVVFGGGLKN